MGLFDSIRRAAAVSEHQLLSKQLSENQAKGLDRAEAGGVLIAQRWNLPTTPIILARAYILSKNLGELVVGFLMFAKRIHVTEAVKQAFVNDSFFNLHGCLYGTVVPLTNFARKPWDLLWQRQRVDPLDACDAGFAAYYATLICPFAVDAWLMLADLKPLGFCPEIDKRDHVVEGLRGVRSFLETATNADPEFRMLLSEGMAHLSLLTERAGPARPDVG